MAELVAQQWVLKDPIFCFAGSWLLALADSKRWFLSKNDGRYLVLDVELLDFAIGLDFNAYYTDLGLVCREPWPELDKEGGSLLLREAGVRQMPVAIRIANTICGLYTQRC